MSAMSPRFWTTGQVRTVLAAVASGARYADAGALVGRTKEAVSWVIRRHPDAPRRPRGRPRKVVR